MKNETNSAKYLVREVLIAKPGHAGELAQMMKKEMDGWKEFNGHVLLDMVTSYNKIVIEYTIDSLTEFENMMTDFKKTQAKTNTKKPPKYTEFYQTGKREIYKIV
jgi:hypothetical protein